MAKKNSSVLWTVEQSLAKAEKKTARANIGVDSLPTQSHDNQSTLTFVSDIVEDATTGNLSCKTKNVKVSNTYDAQSSDPASGSAIAAAIDKLNLNNTLELGKYYSGISVVNGVAEFSQSAMDIVPTLNSKVPVTSDGVAKALNAKVINNASLKIQKNGVDVATFTANAATNVTANISVPTKTSDLDNDSGFITSSDIPSQVQSNWTQSDSTAVDFIRNKRAFKTFVTSYDYPDCKDVRNPGANTKVLVYFPYENRKKVQFVDGRVYNLKITTSGILPQDDTIEAITARLFTLDTDGNRKYLCPAYTFKAGNSVQFDLHWEASGVYNIGEAYLDECAPHIEFDCILKANTDFTIYCNGLEWFLNENVAI